MRLDLVLVRNLNKKEGGFFPPSFLVTFFIEVYNTGM